MSKKMHVGQGHRAVIGKVARRGSYEMKMGDSTRRSERKRSEFFSTVLSHKGFERTLLTSLKVEYQAYFARTSTLKALAQNSPELLALPFEGMRAMGVLERLDPKDCVYTFCSHQWESPEHPFTSLLQITEHIDLVETPYVWVDWYCCPQWSRTGKLTHSISEETLDKSMPQRVFESTMNNFHKLCLCAKTSLIVVKRASNDKVFGAPAAPRGLTLRKRNFASELCEGLDSLSSANTTSTLSGDIAHAQDLVRQMESSGVDLEHGIRAWCAAHRLIPSMWRAIISLP